MKIKEQTRKLAAGCSKHCFEVVDRTDEVSSLVLRELFLFFQEVIFLYFGCESGAVVPDYSY